MLRLPREWVMLAGLLAAIPSVTLAGPFDFLNPRSRRVVSAQSDATNQQVADQVAAALKQAKLKGFDISIEVADGVATLSGKIHDAEQKTVATKVTSEVDGIVSVNNQLELVSAARKAPVQQAGFEGNPSQSKTVQQVKHQRASRNNQQVAQQIADALVAAGLGEHDIEIRYKEGACSLIGSYDTPEQAITAYQLAAGVPEVKQVITRLSVGGREFKLEGVHPVSYSPPRGQPALAVPQRAWAGPEPSYAPPHMRAPHATHPTPGGVLAPPPGVHPAGGPAGQAPYPVTPAGYPHTTPGRHFGNLGHHEVYNSPNLPQYAWPTQAYYDNYAAVSYPSKYDASAWPYIGPYYPYPQVPLGWRDAQLSWDDGYWNLKFNSRTDKWWWFLNPENWD